MALFEFELSRVEDILPWGEPGQQTLSWFALTDGQFRIVVGEQVLFRYTEEILSHWGEAQREVDYYIGALARDILGSVSAAVAPLSPRVERLASDWNLLTKLEHPPGEDSAVCDRWYEAWRWLGARSPWTSYLVACPKLQFVRVGDELRIHWDNREKMIDGHPVWTARQGVHIMSVEEFLHECRNFAKRLLSAMQERIAGIESGAMKPQVEVSTQLLREQHAAWRAEFASYFDKRQRDISWQDAENALQAIAEKRGLPF